MMLMFNTRRNTISSAAAQTRTSYDLDFTLDIKYYCAKVFKASAALYFFFLYFAVIKCSILTLFFIILLFYLFVFNKIN